MVRVTFRLARQAVRTDGCADARELQRQKDRRGTLAVKSGPPTRGRGGVADSVRPLQVDDCGPPVRRPRSYYRPDPPRVERHSAAPTLFVAGRFLGTSPGGRALLSPEPRRQTHLCWLGGPLGAPRLSSPRWEPEEEDSLAITTDDLMKSSQIESVASNPRLLNYIVALYLIIIGLIGLFGTGTLLR